MNDFAFYASPPQNSDNASLRIQRNISKEDRLSFRLAGQRRDGDNVQTFGFLDTTSGYGITTSVGWTHNLSSRRSTMRVTFNRNVSETTPFFANGADVASELGIAGSSANPLTSGRPT